MKNGRDALKMTEMELKKMKQIWWWKKPKPFSKFWV